MPFWARAGIETHRSNRKGLFMKPISIYFSAILLAFTISGCSSTNDSTKTISGALDSTNDQSYNYIVDFTKAEDAARHAKEVRASGGEVVALDKEGRILHVKAGLGDIGNLNVPSDTLIANNAQ